MARFEIPQDRLEQIEAENRKIAYPYLLVDDARRAAGRAGDPEMVYGTTPPSVVLGLLDFAEATSEDIFYDLGCGLGVPTIVTALFCKRAVGFEILPEVAQRASEVAQGLQLENASFEVTDFKSADLSEGTVIYCYSTCLQAQSRAEVAQGVSRTRPGARVLTVTHNLEHPALELKESRELSWEGSRRTVYLHVRR